MFDADRDEAIGWYEKAAVLRNAAAMTALGDLKDDARVVSQGSRSGRCSRVREACATTIKGDEARELYERAPISAIPRRCYELARIENRPELSCAPPKPVIRRR